jgi:phenylpropionate dioxygenase-like ring-hydroxylating dioxygenase large terminal subunit
MQNRAANDQKIPADKTGTSSRKPRTLGPEFYRSEEILNLEKKHVFQNEWVCAGRLTDWPNEGDYTALDVGGEPIVVWRGRDGVLRAFENVCRHRMAVIADGSGTAGSIVCPYHRWTYGSDGNLRAAPGVADELKGEKICLPELQLEVWQGFVFVNADLDAPPLGPRLKELDEILDVYQLSDFSWSQRNGSRSIGANWKLVLENGMEGYHIPYVHEHTLAPYVERKGHIHGGDYWSMSYEPRTKMMPASPDDPPGLTDKLRGDAYTIGIFPCTFINIDCDAVAWLTVQPDGVDACQLTSGGSRRSGPGFRRIGDVDLLSGDEFATWATELTAEDTDICERIQRGVNAVHAKAGLLIDAQEGNLENFHNFIRRKIGIDERAGTANE